VELLRRIKKTEVAVDTILFPQEHGLVRPIRLIQEYEDGVLSRIKFADAEYERKFVTQAFVQQLPEGRFIAFSAKTKLMPDEEDRYGFLVDGLYHPDLMAGRFFDQIISSVEQGDFGAIAGLRGRWYNLQGKNQNYRQYMEARQKKNDEAAAAATWTSRKFAHRGYHVWKVQEKFDQVDGCISEVKVLFCKP